MRLSILSSLVLSAFTIGFMACGDDKRSKKSRSPGFEYHSDISDYLIWFFNDDTLTVDRMLVPETVWEENCTFSKPKTVKRNMKKLKKALELQGPSYKRLVYSNLGPGKIGKLKFIHHGGATNVTLKKMLFQESSKTYYHLQGIGNCTPKKEEDKYEILRKRLNVGIHMEGFSGFVSYSLTYWTVKLNNRWYLYDMKASYKETSGTPFDPDGQTLEDLAEDCCDTGKWDYQKRICILETEENYLRWNECFVITQKDKYVERYSETTFELENPVDMAKDCCKHVGKWDSKKQVCNFPDSHNYYLFDNCASEWDPGKGRTKIENHYQYLGEIMGN